MRTQNTLARSLHDIGLAGWFGGSLMGAVGLNGASDQVADPHDRAAVANAGWARWTPVNAVAIAAHLLGGAQLVRGNLVRLVVQPRARRVGAAKAVVTLAALGATAYSRRLGQQLMDADADADAVTGDADADADAVTGDAAGVPDPGAPGDVPVESAVAPLPATRERAASAQRRLRAMQWVVPASTGVLLVLNAKAGEQQRTGAVLLDRVRAGIPLALRIAPSAIARLPWHALPWKLIAGSTIGLVVAVRRARRGRRRGPTARDIMTTDVVSVSPQDTLQHAARFMVDSNVGALPVRANGRVAGMVTDRDIVAHMASSGADLSQSTVGEIATTSPVTVSADDPLAEVVRAMAAGKVRRVPVVDDGELVGIISQADVAATGDDAMTGDLVEAISAAG